MRKALQIGHKDLTKLVGLLTLLLWSSSLLGAAPCEPLKDYFDLILSGKSASASFKTVKTGKTPLPQKAVASNEKALVKKAEVKKKVSSTKPTAKKNGVAKKSVTVGKPKTSPASAKSITESQVGALDKHLDLTPEALNKLLGKKQADTPVSAAIAKTSKSAPPVPAKKVGKYIPVKKVVADSPPVRKLATKAKKETDKAKKATDFAKKTADIAKRKAAIAEKAFKEKQAAANTANAKRAAAKAASAQKKAKQTAANAAKAQKTAAKAQQLAKQAADKVAKAKEDAAKIARAKEVAEKAAKAKEDAAKIARVKEDTAKAAKAKVTKVEGDVSGPKPNDIEMVKDSNGVYVKKEGPTPSGQAKNTAGKSITLTRTTTKRSTATSKAPTQGGKQVAVYSRSSEPARGRGVIEKPSTTKLVSTPDLNMMIANLKLSELNKLIGKTLKLKFKTPKTRVKSNGIGHGPDWIVDTAGRTVRYADFFVDSAGNVFKDAKNILKRGEATFIKRLADGSLEFLTSTGKVLKILAKGVGHIRHINHLKHARSPTRFSVGQDEREREAEAEAARIEAARIEAANQDAKIAADKLESANEEAKIAADNLAAAEEQAADAERKRTDTQGDANEAADARKKVVDAKKKAVDAKKKAVDAKKKAADAKKKAVAVPVPVPEVVPEVVVEKPKEDDTVEDPNIVDDNSSSDGNDDGNEDEEEGVQKGARGNDVRPTGFQQHGRNVIIKKGTR